MCSSSQVRPQAKHGRFSDCLEMAKKYKHYKLINCRPSNRWSFIMQAAYVPWPLSHTHALTVMYSILAYGLLYLLSILDF